MNTAAGSNGVWQLGRRYAGEAARGFSRTPAEFAAALAVAVAFSTALELGDPSQLSFSEIASTAVLTVVVAWTATWLHALGRWSARTRWLVTVAGAVVLGAFGYFFLHMEHEANGWRAALLIIAGVLWVLALPVFAAGGDPATRVRVMDGRLLLRLLGAGSYGMALFAGLALALAAINSLFELKLDGQIYGHVWGWIAFVLVPWVVFSGIDDYVRTPDAPPSGAAALIHRITVYLALPLLVLYFAILYAYAVRIGVTGELPKNLVSPMVLAAGVLAVAALMLFDPRPGAGGVARTLRAAPVLFLPLSILGAWAILQRIDQYGWTEFRVMRLVGVVALAALAAAAVGQLVRRRAFALHVVPLTLAAVFLLAAVGPWSATAVSRRSQERRLESALARAAAIAPTPGDTLKTVPARIYDDVQGSAQYLHTHFGASALPPELARHARSAERWVEFGTALRLRRAPDESRPSDERAGYRFAALAPGARLSTASGEAYRVDYETRGRGEPQPGITITQDALTLRLNIDRELFSADITPLLELRGQARRGPAEKAIEPARMVLPLVAVDGSRRGDLVLMDVDMNFDSARAKIVHFSGLVLLPRTE